MSEKIPVLSFIGKSGVGKTTLLEKVIPVLKSYGIRLATIKHHAHAGFEIDHPGKDTWRHAQAGSDLVIISAPDKIASIRQLQQELSLDEILANIQDVDIILTEGYKRAGKPSLEIVRSENGTEIISSSQQLQAVATDIPLEVDVPQFHLDDAPAIARWIVEDYLALSGAKRC